MTEPLQLCHLILSIQPIGFVFGVRPHYACPFQNATVLPLK